MTEYVVEASDDEFVLPITGFVCAGLEDGVVIDDAPVHVDLLLHNKDFTETARIRIADSAYRPRVLGLSERRAGVERAVATAESTLVLEFEGGEALEVPAGEYEAWEVEGPGLVKVIAPAGGGEPAIFDATSETRTIRPDEPLPRDLEAALKSFGLPRPTEAFELRRTTGRTKSIELRAATEQRED